MKTRTAISLGLCCLMLAVASHAAKPDMVNYQGKLLQGTNLMNGSVPIVFRVYTNATSGAYVYEETNIVTVVDGYYSIMLGENANYGKLKQVMKLDSAYLELTVDGQTLAPREEFAPPPYAKRSEQLWQAFGTDLGANGPPDSAAACLQYPSLGVVGTLGESFQNWLVFPPPAEPVEVVEVSFNFQAYKSSEPSNCVPIITAAIGDFIGAPERWISEPLPARALPWNAWTNLTLIGTVEERTIMEDEVLWIRWQYAADTNKAYQTSWHKNVMVKARVR